MPRSDGKSALKQHVQDYLDKARALDRRLDKIQDESVKDIHDVLDSATPLLTKSGSKHGGCNEGLKKSTTR